MRSTGWRRVSKASPAAPALGDEGELDQQAESDEDSDAAPATQADKDYLAKCDPSLLASGELKKMFGDEAAQIRMAMFQTSNNITPAAAYLREEAQVKVTMGEAAAPAPYRKAQVHPDVYLEALQSALSTSTIPLAKTEALVILTGGAWDVLFDFPFKAQLG